LKIIDPSSDGAIKFVITSEVQESEFELTIGGQGEDAPPYVYNRTKGPMVKIQRGSSALTPLEEWLDRDPLVVMYADGSFSYNHFFVDAACPGKFDSQLLETIDWTGINLRKESEGPDRHEDSIQYRAISNIIDDFDVVFNDDGTGEAADVIGLRQDSNDNILLLLLHCKFSLDDKPGARVDDLYQVCGQAQKCIRWKHGGLGRLIAHMKTRQNKWQPLGKTRFIKGNMSGLRRIEKLSRRMKMSFEVRIVQPGLSKSRVSEQILFLLGTTDLFLKRTADAKMTIICSD